MSFPEDFNCILSSKELIWSTYFIYHFFVSGRNHYWTYTDISFRWEFSQFTNIACCSRVLRMRSYKKPDPPVNPLWGSSGSRWGGRATPQRPTESGRQHFNITAVILPPSKNCTNQESTTSLTLYALIYQLSSEFKNFLSCGVGEINVPITIFTVKKLSTGLPHQSNPPKTHRLHRTRADSL